MSAHTPSIPPELPVAFAVPSERIQQRWCCDVAWVGNEPCWCCGSSGQRWQDLPAAARPPAWASSFSGSFTDAGDELPVGPWAYRFEAPV